MKPKRIILIRHGESQGNVDKTMYETTPDYKLRLTENGVNQAKVCGNTLKNLIKEDSCFFYVSPFWRTRDTFNNIKLAFENNSILSKEEPRLREQEWGHLRSVEELKKIDQQRDDYGTFYYRIPEGESGADVYDRVSDFFGTIHRDFSKPDFSENCVIVSHGMTIRIFLMKWLHWTVEEFENLRNPKNCQIIILEKQENTKYELISSLEKRF